MKTAHLGKLEQKIMDIVWQQGNCSTREVLVELQKEKKLAYTTIATILNRLVEKDLLVRKVNGVRFTYTSAFSKEKYAKGVAQTFLKRFINSFGDTAVASFAESIDRLPEDKRKYFLKLLKENEKAK